MLETASNRPEMRARGELAKKGGDRKSQDQSAYIPTLIESGVDRHLAAEATRFASIPAQEGRFPPARRKEAVRGT
jgi:hypothetical protein